MAKVLDIIYEDDGTYTVLVQQDDGSVWEFVGGHITDYRPSETEEMETIKCVPVKFTEV